MEKPRIERLEDLLEVVMVAYRCQDALTSSGLPNVLGLSRDGLRRDMPPVAVGVDRGDRFLVQLGQQDMSDRVVNRFGCVLEQIRQPDVEPSLTKANRSVQARKPAEADID